MTLLHFKDGRNVALWPSTKCYVFHQIRSFPFRL